MSSPSLPSKGIAVLAPLRGFRNTHSHAPTASTSAKLAALNPRATLASAAAAADWEAGKEGVGQEVLVGEGEALAVGEGEALSVGVGEALPEGRRGSPSSTRPVGSLQVTNRYPIPLLWVGR